MHTLFSVCRECKCEEGFPCGICSDIPPDTYFIQFQGLGLQDMYDPIGEPGIPSWRYDFTFLNGITLQCDRDKERPYPPTGNPGLIETLCLWQSEPFEFNTTEDRRDPPFFDVVPPGTRGLVWGEVWFFFQDTGSPGWEGEPVNINASLAVSYPDFDDEIVDFDGAAIRVATNLTSWECREPRNATFDGDDFGSFSIKMREDDTERATVRLSTRRLPDQPPDPPDPPAADGNVWFDGSNAVWQPGDNWTWFDELSRRRQQFIRWRDRLRRRS